MKLDCGHGACAWQARCHLACCMVLQDAKGKGKWQSDAGTEGMLALDVPLELLGKPICKRSSAHLEATLHVIEVRFMVLVSTCD